MRTAALVLLLAAAALSCDTRCQWARWKVRYGKAYPSQAEDDARFAAFSANAAKVDANPDLELNKFADLTLAEFLRSLTPLRVTEQDVLGNARAAAAATSRRAAARRVTPRDYISPWAMTPIRDQMHCSCCYAFATTHLVEIAVNKTFGRYVPLAPQQLVDCDVGSSACEGGSVSSNLWYLKAATRRGTGFLPESVYHYDSQYASWPGGHCGSGLCLAGNRTSGDAAKVTGYDYTQPDESVGGAIEQAVLDHGAVVVYFNASIIHLLRPGAIARDDGKCSQGGIDHAVVIVGWGVDNSSGEETSFWVVKNSWGDDWGCAPDGSHSTRNGRGYFRIERFKNTCLMFGHLALTVTVGNASQSCHTDRAKLCGTRQCGSTWDDCTETHVNCGWCAETEVCRSGACQARICEKVRTCRNRCGRVLDDCGHSVECGQCASDKYCTAGGYCRWDDDE
eukprot:m51a1_g9619 hypothetical protein (451) ;mRNA; r:1095712-1097140